MHSEEMLKAAYLSNCFNPFLPGPPPTDNIFKLLMTRQHNTTKP